MEKFRAKMKKQGGFTLVEMLIVVAIIAILIAVAIPLVNTALERASKATDAANERSAKAVATVQYLADATTVDGSDSIWADGADDSKIAYFDADKGILVNDDTNLVGYGKCSKHKGGYIVVTLNQSYDPTDEDSQLVEIRWDGIDDTASNGGEDWLDSKELTTGDGDISTTP